jgi:rod shape-determining protein MreD
MRWLPFLILAYVFVAVQFSLGSVLHHWGEWTPNLVLLLVLFIGMHAMLEPALVAGLILGLMHDVIASHGIGTYALGYAMLAFFAVQLRGIMYSDHIVTHVMMPFLLGVILVVYLVFRQWVRGFYYPPDDLVSFGGRFMGVLVTTAAAIPVIGLLRKIRKVFAFENRQ